MGPSKHKKFAGRKSKPLKEENPFEKFANARKKHDVINRRVKGEDRNVGRAREKAMEVRKNKLLKDFVSSKKSNTFYDKRFGEQDSTLSVEEKMFMRFQHEKMKKVKNKSKFNLDDAETHVLTHRGQALGDAVIDSDWHEMSDDDNLGKEVVNNLHFGGGFVEAKKHSGGTKSDSMQSHSDMLQEIVMKSKMYKLEKKEAKDAQEDQREILDKAYSELVKSSMLEFKPTKKDRSELSTGDDNEISEYDRALRVMAFESRVQPSERTKSKEELAREEYERLEALEKERLQRMKANDPENDVINSALFSKTTKKRKAPSLNDDCIEELYDAEDSEEYSDSNLSGSDDDEDSQASESEDDSCDDEESDEGEADDGSIDEDVEGEITVDVRTYNELPPADTDMPYIIECPVDISEFDNLVKEYVRSVSDLSELVSRIMSCHSIHISTAVQSSNKEKLSGFLQILVTYFIRLGDSLARCHDCEKLSYISSELDSIASAIFKLAADLPDVFRLHMVKLIMSMRDNTTKDLGQVSANKQAKCWPSLGQILWIQQLGLLYSASDYRHGIIGPVLLFSCQNLMWCPLRNLSDLASGLLLCSVILDMTSVTDKAIPEVVSFMTRALGSLLDSDCQSLKPILQAESSTKLDISGRYPLSWSAFSLGSTASDTGVASGVVFTVLSILNFLALKASFKHSTELYYYLHRVARRCPFDSLFPQLQSAFIDEDLDCLARSREPLQWRKQHKTVMSTLNPAFQVDYNMKKVDTKNQDKAKLKTLTKQLKREQKASMRELRRDAEFLDQQNFTEKNAYATAKKEERARNYAWLEQEQATFNQQVRLGKGSLKGGGTGGAPKRKREKESNLKGVF